MHLFPQIRDAVLRVTKELAPDAWVRQCGQLSARRRLTDHKALLLDGLSRRFRRLAADHGLRTNPAFAGTYTFRSDAAYARHLRRSSIACPTAASSCAIREKSTPS